MAGIDGELGPWSRRWVEAHHDPDVLVARLVDLYGLAIERLDAEVGRSSGEELIRSRFAGFYPSLRRWHRVPDNVDWGRASTPFPVWAPDVDDELPVVLSAMAQEVEAAPKASFQVRVEITAPRWMTKLLRRLWRVIREARRGCLPRSSNLRLVPSVSQVGVAAIRRLVRGVVSPRHPTVRQEQRTPPDSGSSGLGHLGEKAC